MGVQKWGEDISDRKRSDIGKNLKKARVNYVMRTALPLKSEYHNHIAVAPLVNSMNKRKLRRRCLPTLKPHVFMSNLYLKD